jgi:hypothetical protein
VVNRKATEQAQHFTSHDRRDRRLTDTPKRGFQMEAQKTAVEAIVALTGYDRAVVAEFIRRFYLAGVRDPKRLTFKGLQAFARS